MVVTEELRYGGTQIIKLITLWISTQLTIESKIASKFTLNFLFENTDISNTMAMATDIVRSS